MQVNKKTDKILYNILRFFIVPEILWNVSSVFTLNDFVQMYRNLALSDITIVLNDAISRCRSRIEKSYKR